jgi:death-on-curing protein
MKEPIWVHIATARQIHREQLEQFGGLAGVRDEGLFESAMSRPMNLWHYASPSLFDMAASYAFGIANNHPFIDGNKRTAFVVSVLFLELNGLTFAADEVSSAEKFIELASGQLPEAELAHWFKLNSTPSV